MTFWIFVLHFEYLSYFPHKNRNITLYVLYNSVPRVQRVTSWLMLAFRVLLFYMSYIIFINYKLYRTKGGGRVVRRCRLSYVTWVSNWYWARPAILAAGNGRGGMFLLCPAIFNRGAYSIPAVRTYVRPVRNTNVFPVISFEMIGILDWNFIHRYIHVIIKCRSSSI